MAKKRHGAEQIIPKLREAEVLLAKGMKSNRSAICNARRRPKMLS